MTKLYLYFCWYWNKNFKTEADFYAYLAKSTKEELNNLIEEIEFVSGDGLDELFATQKKRCLYHEKACETYVNAERICRAQIERR